MYLTGIQVRTIKSVFWVTLLVCLTAMTGCAGTQIKSDNSLVQTNPNAPFARVYFLRPRTERTMGVADNVINIELDRQPLLTLTRPVDGEFRGVFFVPREVDLLTAKEIAKRLRAVGPASREPIQELQG